MDTAISGAGSFLLRYVIDFAMKYGASYIALEADIRNDKLIRWYESFGFEDRTGYRD
jgi:ribosomal protein S18 acetylase RimI-like enzyme